VQDKFMNEEVRAIVATNAFGMGIDKPNVRLVVHHAMPGTLEAYYQEAGRAGRDGGASECFLLHSFPDRFTHEFFIRGAYPDRILVDRTYDVLRRRADATGLIRVVPEDLLAAMPPKTTSREVESALRVLAKGGAIRTEPDSMSRVFVRLLATPERIKRELGAGREQERELLRALWRAVGTRLSDGAVIDLDGLPPGFGGGQGVVPLLEALEGAQFVEWERTGGGTRLENPRAELSAFDIDWAGIESRRASDMAKLKRMEGYAYATGCRRAFVLRYFGDPAARPECGNCDNCLGIKHSVDPTTVAQSARSTRKPATRSKAERAGDRESFATRVAEQRAEITLDEEAAALFAELRTLRGAIAREEQVPAYVVFPDRTLAEIATRRPRSSAALADIRGVGPAKLEKYGERFLALVREAGETEAA
jgi:ATP-dependent DNA helicase RecQ